MWKYLAQIRAKMLVSLLDKNFAIALLTTKDIQ